MSLIKCPECGESVSSKAPFCPHCGVLIAGNVKRCPVCDTYVLMNAEECPKCNAKFVNTSQPFTLKESTTPPPIAGLFVAAGTTANTTTATTDELPQQEAPTEVNDTPPASHEQLPATKSHTPWYLLVLLILAIGIGGFFYWENQNQQAAEEAAFALLQDCKNPLNYEDFIAKYPDSKHIDEVRQRLKALQIAVDEWNAAIKSGNVEKLRDFIKKYPDSPFKKQAIRGIDSLDWLYATSTGTSAAYQQYIERHDNGEHIDEAFTARDEAVEREEQARKDSVAAALAKALLADSLETAASATTGTDVIVN